MNKEKTILVVDNEVVVCNALKKFLTKKGYKVSIALNGEEAIKKVKRKSPCIILLDIKMPKMHGIEVLQRIKEIDKNIGIIMITAVKDEKIGRRCMELGAYDYITKPLGLEYLENVLMVKFLNFEKRTG